MAPAVVLALSVAGNVCKDAAALDQHRCGHVMVKDSSPGAADRPLPSVVLRTRTKFHPRRSRERSRARRLARFAPDKSARCRGTVVTSVHNSPHEKRGRHLPAMQRRFSSDRTCLPQRDHWRVSLSAMPPRPRSVRRLHADRLPHHSRAGEAVRIDARCAQSQSAVVFRCASRQPCDCCPNARHMRTAVSTEASGRAATLIGDTGQVFSVLTRFGGASRYP